MGYSGGQNAGRQGELRVVEAFSVIFTPYGVVRTNKDLDHEP
jgi:hypothetical protein